MLCTSIPEERPCKSGASNFWKMKTGFNDLIKILMYNFVRTKDKWMKTQIFCFKTIISKMAIIVRFVKGRNICQCRICTVVGINYSPAKSKKRLKPYIATLFGRYCTENPFIYMSYRQF